jgi:hypothetical protein
MEKEKPLRQLHQRYARLCAKLSKAGLVLQGTITERAIVRSDPQRPQEEKTYGPYYQWTFKRNAKTVTVNLSKGQVKAYQRAIDNHRKTEQILDEMRVLSLEILERSTTGVPKRSRKRNAND